MHINYLLKARYIPLLLAVLTFFLSLLLTYMLWNSAERSAEKSLRTEFNFRAREVMTQIVQRMATYEQVLRGTKGFLNSSTEVSRDEFRTYIDSLMLNGNFPGIQGIGIANVIPKARLGRHIAAIRNEGFPQYTVWPTGERDIYSAITKIEPFNKMNRRAHGYDMFSEPVRRAAMARARDTGNAALSGKVRLVQEDITDIQSGFLMYLPLYQPNTMSATVEQRRANLVGWVYAPFRMRDFMRSLGSERLSELDITIYSGNTMSAQSCLFGCTNTPSQRSMLRTRHQLDIANYPWTFDIGSTPVFESRRNDATPNLIAGGGIVTSLLLALLVWFLTSGRSRAVALARQMTQELRASHDHIAAEQRRIKVILENSHDAFIAIDATGAVTDWNLQAERTFGWAASEAIGKDLAELIIPVEQRAAHNAGFKRFTSTGTGPVINNRIELHALHRNGAKFPVELAIAAVKDGTGYTSNAFLRDLTETKAIEQREAEQQQALDDARIALQHAQKMEAVGNLTGGVAHDFNNVLQVISGNIQLLLHDTGPGEKRVVRLNNILKAVDRAAKLSSQLLAFARRQPLEPKVVDIYRLIRQMDDMLRRALGAEIDIEIVSTGGLWHTLVDPHQLENVLLNLVINARDAMPGGGKLTIELGNATLDDDYVRSVPDVTPGQYVMLAISDTGTGMTPDVMAQVFEPFFTTKPAGEGTGLGLSMAYGFVKQSGGHIRLYSEAGHGTTVRIYLPRSFDAEEEAPRLATDTPDIGGNETILVVEDDPGVQESVVATLTELGYCVLKANDGQGALELIKSGVQIDLLFTDVVMPGPVRSTDLVQEVKSLRPQVAVLFTSGYTQSAIIHGGRLDPGVNLLSKPYRREQLARKLRQVLEH